MCSTNGRCHKLWDEYITLTITKTVTCLLRFPIISLLKLLVSNPLSLPNPHRSQAFHLFVSLNTLLPQYFHTFYPVIIAEVHIISSKSSPPDHHQLTAFPPAVTVKTCPSIFAELIAELSNTSSFREGGFPSCFKYASVTPIHKQPDLDKSTPSNYRPFSNLDFMSASSLFAFSLMYSPAPLQQIPVSIPPQLFHWNRSCFNAGFHFPFIWFWHIHSPGLFEFCAVFDTINHNMLINQPPVCQLWIVWTLPLLDSVYFDNRTQSVRFGRHSSSPTTCSLQPECPKVL